MRGFVFAASVMFSFFAFEAKAEYEKSLKQPLILNFIDNVWQRPAHSYQLTEYADKDICVGILHKLNEPYSSERVPQNGYFGVFTNNSATLPWQKRTAHSNDPIYFLQADIDGNGVKEWVYKAYAPVASKYIAFLTVENSPLGDDKESDYDIKRKMYKQDVITYDKKFSHGFPQSSFLRDPEMSFMKIDQSESMIVLNGESNQDRFCKGPYEVFAFLANKRTEDMPLPFCRFITRENVKCKFPR